MNTTIIKKNTTMTQQEFTWAPLRGVFHPATNNPLELNHAHTEVRDAVTKRLCTAFDRKGNIIVCIDKDSPVVHLRTPEALAEYLGKKRGQQPKLTSDIRARAKTLANAGHSLREIEATLKAEGHTVSRSALSRAGIKAPSVRLGRPKSLVAEQVDQITSLIDAFCLNQAQAAELAGISKSTLQRVIKEHHDVKSVPV